MAVVLRRSREQGAGRHALSFREESLALSFREESFLSFREEWESLTGGGWESTLDGWAGGSVKA